jgi:hypothetical protein
VARRPEFPLPKIRCRGPISSLRFQRTKKRV